MRALDIDPVEGTRETFRALVDAMARPGTVQSLPVEPADHAVLATLVDQEVTLWTDDDRARDAFHTAGRYQSAPIEEAAIVHLTASDGVPLGNLRQGTDERPEQGATVVYNVEAVTADTDGTGTTLAVSGPGVPSTRTVHVRGLSVDEARDIAATQSLFPRGVDYVLVAPERIVALPRSVDLEVV